MLVQSIVVTTSIISTLNWLTAWRPLIGCTRNLQRLTAFLAGKPNLNLIGGDGGPLPNRTARSCDTPSPSIYGAIDSFRRLIITPILVLSPIWLVWTGNNPAKNIFPLHSLPRSTLSLSSLSFSPEKGELAKGGTKREREKEVRKTWRKRRSGE